MNKDQREIQRKLRILRHAEETGHVAKTCRNDKTKSVLPFLILALRSFVWR